MSNWYADINTDSTSGVGTSANPFNKENLQNFLNQTSGTLGEGGSLSAVQDNDVIYIKGHYYSLENVYLFPESSNECSANNVHLVPWDFENNGHWKIGSSGDIYLFPVSKTEFERKYYLSGCVLYEDGNGSIKINPDDNVSTEKVGFEINNSIILGNLIFNSRTSQLTTIQDIFKGCTFANGQFSISDYDDLSDQHKSEVYFNNCLFYNWVANISSVSGTSALDKATFDYCVFSGTSADIFSYNANYDSVVLNNCEFEWIPSIEFPNVSAFSKETLSFEKFGLNYNFGSSALDGSSMKQYFTTNGMNEGAYSSNRRGVGSMYFSNNIFYIDTSAEEGYGTTTSPFNATQFARNITYENDIYKIKGSITNTELFLNRNVTLESWDQNENGPYKITQLDKLISGSDFIVKDGVFIFSNYSNFNFKFSPKAIYNSFIVTSGSPKLDLSLQEVSAFGSSFIFEGMTYWGLYNNLNGIAATFVDCIFDMSCFCGNVALDPSVSAVAKNCVFTSIDKNALIGNMFSTSAQIIDTDCQYDWSGLTISDLSTLEKDDFNFSILTSSTSGSTITISGSNDWDDYPFGLWGNERYSVGAFYFNNPNVLTNMNVVDTSISSLDPTITGDSLSLLNLHKINLNALDPRIYAFKDITVDFTTNLVKGVSPLYVKYTAIVTFGGSTSGRFKIKEYRWYFDYDNHPTEYVTSTIPVIYHMHTGVKGTKHSVKLDVIIEEL